MHRWYVCCTLIVLALASPAVAQIGQAPMLYQYQGPSLGGIWTPSPSAGTSITGGSSQPCSTTIGGGQTAGLISGNCDIQIGAIPNIILHNPVPSSNNPEVALANITIDPTVAGNIILFSGNSGDSGMIEFANQANFIPANGIAACPGVNPNNPPWGVNATIKGFVPFEDWLGNLHGWPAC